MVPCSWFPATAKFCREHPDVDMGVHLTLTCEWEWYRWGPISTRDPASGMLDADGYFPRRSRPVQENGDPQYVQTEVDAQVERALAAGIPVTHLDTHMGTVVHSKFIGGVIQTGIRHRIPVMFFRKDEAGWRKAGLDAEGASTAARLVEMLEEEGMKELPKDRATPRAHSPREVRPGGRPL